MLLYYVVIHGKAIKHGDDDDDDDNDDVDATSMMMNYKNTLV